MAKTKAHRDQPFTDEEGEVRELTREDLRTFRPLQEVDPELAGIVARRKRGDRGPQKRPTKTQISLRLSEKVLSYYRSTGQGWQSRINEALEQRVDEASKSSSAKK